jgi:hypothetical protein
MSKNNKKPYPGKKKNSVTSIVMRVFEKNPESELSHKQVSSLVDAKDPASRQLVFDCLNQLFFLLHLYISSSIFFFAQPNKQLNNFNFF